MSTNTKQRKMHIELLRILCCFYMIYTHTAGSRLIDYQWLFNTRNVGLLFLFLAKTCVPVFFVISGANLISKDDDWAHWRKRVLRASCALLIFSILYYIYYCQIGYAQFYGETPTITGFISAFFKNPISNALWYMYVYTIALVIMPILRKLRLDAKEFLLLTVVYALIQGIPPFFEHYLRTNLVSSYFSLSILPVTIYLFLLGDFLENRAPEGFYCAKGAALVAILLVADLAFSLGAIYYEFGIYSENSMNVYLVGGYATTFVSTYITFAHYYLFKYFCDKYSANHVWHTGKVISYLGSLTFGAYLFSDLFVSLLQERCWNENINKFLAILLVDVCVFACSMITCAILKAIPGIKKLTGKIL